MGGRLHINRRLMQATDQNEIIPPEHYGGRKGNTAVEAVLNKRLMLDNLRLTATTATVTSTDVANCYDRMIHNVVSLCGQCLGITLAVMTALLRPLQISKHYIRTAYADSTTYYGGERDIPYQGSGQGNAGSSPYWLLVSSSVIDNIKTNQIYATLISSHQLHSHLSCLH